MPSSITGITSSTGITSRGDRAAAMARHPAGRRRRPAAPPGFAGMVELMTGDWRVTDPDGFAAAMTHAPEIAGHPVADAARGAPSLPDRLVRPIVAAAGRELDVRWVAGSHNGWLFVETRAVAPRKAAAPELFVIAHLVEPLLPAPGMAPAAAGHSWAVVVVGDGAGGVAGIARATLSCPGPGRCCPPPAAALRLPLAALRERLLAPARGEETGDWLGSAAAPAGARVIAFRPCG